MIGVPIKGAVNVCCDNDSVYRNASFDEYQINKNHQTICFHQVSECMAADIIIVHKVDTNDNLADLLTKSIPGWKRVQLKFR